uniref:Xylanolytic transcriptional activator regulatory domain-containing protein n=1 Tax=Kwoniella dejecticola CBS 10117 TaxID=1296121 RepID=A0A1A6A970_9TREE|nr:uncharacterized protein I303_02615 [Kwoniella dejecticola CBS 10117]OBR86606.1 hypothetical protein I303_02615 [Kwoniella dejecticola CBS 10117]
MSFGQQCGSLGIECTTTWRPKRRGPPSEYLKKRLAASNAITNGHSNDIPSQAPASTAISIEALTSPSSHAHPYPYFQHNGYPPTGILRPEDQLRSPKTLTSLSPLSPHAYANMNYNYNPSLQFNSLDNVLGRDIAMYIFSLFFDYVHPLTPCLHRPTFLLEVETRRDEKDPVFLALVLSVLASAIVQIPKALLPPINNVPAREMADRCYQVSRLVSLNAYDPPTIELVITKFLDAVYHLVSGRLGAQVGVSLGLHRESSYVGLDPITTEVRRRMFGLIFHSDKSAACLRDRPMFLATEECDTLMPREIDDEYITRTEYLEFPAGRTSTIAGFKIVGDALVLRRTVRREIPLTPESILAYLRRIESISEDLRTVLKDIPSALRLEETPAPLEIPRVPETNQEWGQDILAQLDVYFTNAHENRAMAKESFLVLKGNIYVTHALARYVLLKCRDEIVEQANLDGSGSVELNVTARMVKIFTGRQDKYEHIVLDLLKALHSIPIQNLAVNGPSLVNKVRYVAVALLDALDAQNPVSPEGAYLLDFLGILSEIEQVSLPRTDPYIDSPEQRIRIVADKMRIDSIIR